MIPTTRLIALALLPLLAALAWMVSPGAVVVVLALDAALLLVGGLDVVWNGGRVSVVREVGAVQSVGTPFDVLLRVRTEGRARDAILGDAAPGRGEGLPATIRLDPAEEVCITYRVCVEQRGQHAFGAVGVRWRSPLGLWWRQQRVELPQSIRVHPDLRHIREAALRARQGEERLPVRARRRLGGESEFERLRPYVPGDAYRHVDWKATARRGAFVTRQFGQEVNQNVIFLLEAGRGATAEIGGLQAFDHALGAALAMGHAALRHGDRVGLLAFGREVRAWLPPRGGLSTASRLVHATYDVFPRTEEPDYAAAFRHLHRSVRRRSLVVLITTLQDEVNAEAATAVVRALGTRHVPLCVQLRDPALERALRSEESGGDTLFRRGAEAELAGWRDETLARWRQRGALVLDCAPAELSARLLSQYLEIKARRLL